MMLRSIAYILIFFLIGISQVMAQTTGSTMTFRHIDVTNGLPDNEVKTLLRLADGRVCVRSTSGLSFYDGSTFRSFALPHAGGIKLNYVSSLPSLYEDSHGLVWVKETGSLMAFDLNADAWIGDVAQRLQQAGLPGGITNFFVDSEGDCWVTTDRLLYVLRHDGGKPQSVKMRAKGLRNLCRIGNRAWLIYSDGMVATMDASSLKTMAVQHLWNKTVLDRDFVRVTQTGKKIWVAWDDGVAVCDVASQGKAARNQWRTLYTDDTHTIASMAAMPDGRVYIGVRQGGVVVVEPDGSHHTIGQIRTSDGETIGDDVCTMMCYDDKLFLGFNNNGIALYSPSQQPFSFYTMPQLGGGIEGNYQMADAANGWAILCSSNGVIACNPTSNTLQPLPVSLIGKDFIGSLTDSRGRLWTGTFRNGLYVVDGSKVSHYRQGETAGDINYDIVRSFAEHNGRVWLAYHGGVGWFDETSHRIVPYKDNLLLGNKNINRIAFDKKGRLWAATNSGLIVSDIRLSKSRMAGTMIKDNGDELNKPCKTLLIDSRGTVWAGTFNGLYALNPETRSLKTFGKADGMPNAMVQGIIEDQLHNIWVTTANGLCRLSSAEDGGYSLTAFDAHDRLTTAKFMGNAVAHTGNGDLLFGCADGIYRISPTSVMATRYKGHPVFTSLLVNNREVAAGQEYDGHVVLDSAMAVKNHLILAHDQNFITISFSGLNFDMPHHTRYKYMLKGMDKEWTVSTPADGEGRAVYTGLKPGRYQLMVYSAGSDNKWCATPAVLTITVRPPWWATWWAETLYAIAIVAAVMLAINLRTRRNRKRLEEENERKLNEMKYRFFTNITHDFRTLLSLIITPVGSLLQGAKDDNERRLLTTVRSNAGELLQLVNELLDFRKLEMGGERLHLQGGNIDEFLSFATQRFMPVASERNIQLTFDNGVGESVLMYFDKDKVGKIINNLLSNAIKFTPDGGSVSVSLSSHDTPERPFVRITVADTGCGISKEEQEHVFERFFRANEQSDTAAAGHGRVRSGSGIGLNMVMEYARLHQGTVSLESEPGKGSSFFVDLPADLKPSAAAKEDTTETEQEAITPQATQTELVDKTVLVVEDNVQFRSFVAGELARVYATVLTAQDGEEALQKACEQVPDIIVSDVMMPRLSGTEMCRRLKDNIETSHVPVVLLTAWSTDEARAEGYRSGADAYISKPFDMQVLLSRMANLLAKQEERRQTFSHNDDLDPKTVATSEADERMLAQAIECVERNITDGEYSVDQMARDLLLSRMSLYRKMKALTGQTPADFMRTVRLKKAARLLATGQLTVQQVCYDTGFSSPQYFAKRFKEMFGVLPSQYK